MDRLDGIRRRHEASLAATVGSFAQHVIYRSTKDHVCPICGGAKKSGYACCISCSTHQHSPHKALLADTVRIFAYAPMECSGDASHQMTRYMYRYKENRPDSERARAAIEEILVTELVLRWGCIKEVSGGVAPTAWATIPSTINSPRAGVEHPLHRIVRQVLPSVPEVGLRAAGVKSRSLSPDLFQLEGEYAPNTLRHVLLIDDTWTTGGNVQSAAVALKRAGAQRVTVFCVARVVNYAFCASIGEGVANGFRSLPFRGGNWCPWHCVPES